MDFTGKNAEALVVLGILFAITVTVCGSIALMVLVNLEAVMRH